MGVVSAFEGPRHAAVSRAQVHQVQVSAVFTCTCQVGNPPLVLWQVDHRAACQACGTVYGLVELHAKRTVEPAEGTEPVEGVELTIDVRRVGRTLVTPGALAPH